MRCPTEISHARWPAIRQHGTDDEGDDGEDLDALLGLTPPPAPGRPDAIDHDLEDVPWETGRGTPTVGAAGPDVGPERNAPGAEDAPGWYPSAPVGGGAGHHDEAGTGQGDVEPWMVDAEPLGGPVDESSVIHTPVVSSPWGDEEDVGEYLALDSISVDAIEPNEFQPRARFVDSELDSLAASIEEVGVLQPVLVRQIDRDRYELIAGERRWRAAIRAGLMAIPAIVRHADDQESLERAVVENLHRADLNALEEAAAYRQLIEEFGMTQDGVAQRVGKSRSAVANLLRLFQLPAAVQRLIASEELSAGHARALLAFPDPMLQEELAARAVREGLSVRKVEELVRAASQRTAEHGSERVAGGVGRTKPPTILAVEELLSDHLATNVDVTTSGERGRIVVEFADSEDLDRIAELVLDRRPESTAPDD